MLQLNLPRHYLNAQSISYFAQARPATRERAASASFDVHLLIQPAPGASDNGGVIRHVSALVSRGRETVDGSQLRLVAQRLAPQQEPAFEIPAERQPAQMLGRRVDRYGTDLSLQPGTYRFEVSVNRSAKAEFLAELR